MIPIAFKGLIRETLRRLDVKVVLELLDRDDSAYLYLIST